MTGYRPYVIIGSFLFVVLGLAGCESQSTAQDRCLDSAMASCFPVAVKECGLSQSSTDAEFDRCAPYMACEDAQFAECMNNR